MGRFLLYLVLLLALCVAAFGLYAYFIDQPAPTRTMTIEPVATISNGGN